MFKILMSFLKFLCSVFYLLIPPCMRNPDSICWPYHFWYSICWILTIYIWMDGWMDGCMYVRVCIYTSYFSIVFRGPISQLFPTGGSFGLAHGSQFHRQVWESISTFLHMGTHPGLHKRLGSDSHGGELYHSPSLCRAKPI